jgi:hypothetical protein
VRRANCPIAPATDCGLNAPATCASGTVPPLAAADCRLHCRCLTPSIQSAPFRSIAPPPVNRSAGRPLYSAHFTSRMAGDRQELNAPVTSHAKAMSPASRARSRVVSVKSNLLFRSFCSLGFVPPSLARLHPGAGRGALRRFLPLAALTSRAFQVKGDRPKPNSRAQKKDHENQIQKIRFRAFEPTRTVGHGTPDE